LISKNKKIKIKIKIIIMQIKKEKKSTRGIIFFWVTRRTHVGEKRKEKGENVEEEQERYERRGEELLLTERGRD